MDTPKFIQLVAVRTGRSTAAVMGLTASGEVYTWTRVDDDLHEARHGHRWVPMVNSV